MAVAVHSSPWPACGSRSSPKRMRSCRVDDDPCSNGLGPSRQAHRWQGERGRGEEWWGNSAPRIGGGVDRWCLAFLPHTTMKKIGPAVVFAPLFVLCCLARFWHTDTRCGLRWTPRRCDDGRETSLCGHAGAWRRRRGGIGCGWKQVSCGGVGLLRWSGFELYVCAEYFGGGGGAYLCATILHVEANKGKPTLLVSQWFASVPVKVNPLRVTPPRYV